MIKWGNVEINNMMIWLNDSKLYRKPNTIYLSMTDYDLTPHCEYWSTLTFKWINIYVSSLPSMIASGECDTSVDIP